MKLVWVTYMGTLSHINAILIPQISAHPPVLAQCKVHRPWTLFRERTVFASVHLLTVSRRGKPVYIRECVSAAVFVECGTRSYEGKSGDYNSISVEFALFGGWVRIMDMIRL